jgi:hypothetical protein
MTRLLFIGDIVGKPGRELVRRGVPPLVIRHEIDLVIVNGENAAAGFGITPDLADDLFEWGVHVITGGNHTWDKKEIFPYFAREPRLLRPANLPAGAPGLGRHVAKAANGVPVAVINIMGRVFMTAIDDPFTVVLNEIDAVRDHARLIFVDFHAEATSEKVAMGWHLDGRVAAVFGTHTHVPTADHQILPLGTAFMSDVGMSGDYNSVIGMDKEEPMMRFLRKISGARFEPASGPATLCALAVETDDATGLARRIAAVRLGGRLEEARPTFWE